MVGLICVQQDLDVSRVEVFVGALDGMRGRFAVRAAVKL